MKRWFIVPAAGTGSRFGSDKPKQYAHLAGKTVLEHTLERLLHIESTAIIVALNPSDTYWQNLDIFSNPTLRTCDGGEQRADTVLRALHSIASEADEMDWVLVHDIARPCIRVSDIQQLINRLAHHPTGGLLATPISDTIKRVKDSADNTNLTVLETVPREYLWAASTPQMFRYGLLTKALEHCTEKGLTPTDEANALEQIGIQAAIVPACSDNLKITHPHDITLAEAILSNQLV